MADNVNIIVQDTINDIVVNAAVVVETIDINVQAAVDVVDIVANPNNYVVNINRIIGEQVQSDWTQTDNQAPDYIKNKPTIPTATSDLTNDGEDGVNPFITAADVTAQVNSDWDATSGVAEILNKPAIPTNTSDLVNDGENGVDPFITAADIPPVTGFVPYTGATQNVDLGEYELKAGQLTLDVSPTGTAAVATTRWNNTIGSSETTLKGGTVVLKNGVDLVARVVNKVTPNATLLRANYTAVRVSGAQGQRLAVAYAQANNDNNSADTIGLICEDIATNQEGFIMTMGQFNEINTSGSLQGETWADGDVLYLSPTTAGRLTNIKPTGATGHIVVMGYVEYAHAIHGSIYVKIMNGWELDELHNVYITSPANNQGLFYDSADSLWKNETIASALGYTPFELPTLTSGSVLFSNGSTIAQKNASFFWDNTNNRLGIGTTTPATALDVNGTIRASTLRADVLNNAANTVTLIQFSGTGNRLFDNSGVQVANIRNSNFQIGTTTDAGYKLDVNGTARVSGRIQSEFNTTTIGTSANNHITLLQDGSINRANIIGFGYVGSTTHYSPAYIGYQTTDFNAFTLGDLILGTRSVSTNTVATERMRIKSTGNVLINTTTDVASSKLTVESTTQGFLPPRMTTTQKNAIATPAAGLVVYDTTLGKLCVRGAAAWETITSI